MLYAKSKPIESIKEHTDKLLENLELLKKLYGDKILINDKLDTRIWSLLEIACKYHDVGKVYTPFQNTILKSIGENEIYTNFSSSDIRHEQLSPIFIPIEYLDKKEKRLIYQAIYYHHEKDNKEINQEVINKIIEQDIIPRLKNIKDEIKIAISEELDIYYLIKYCKERDRIKSGDELYIYYCLIKGLLHRLDHSSSAGIKIEEEEKEGLSSYTTSFMKHMNYDKNELQNFCEKNKNENIVVIGSTGMGKTEAAALWSDRDKTFFTLPIRISINAIYDRICSFGYKSVRIIAFNCT